MRQLVVGNWKMNGLEAEGTARAAAIVSGARDLRCDALICPPATLLATLARTLRGSQLMLGAQDCHDAACGAHTGDISAAMLADLGCRFVMLGHSERRRDHGETDALVCAKVRAALAAGLGPIVCVGETEAERDAGRETEVVGRQIAASLPDGFGGAVAYEPIWAIGTGRTPSVAEVEAVHAHIRAALRDRLGSGSERVRILYGGSVNADNASSLLSATEVGGALVGGASLRAEDFLAIARAAGG